MDETGDGVFDRGLRFVYDGTEAVLVYDDAGALKKRLLYGPGVDQVFAEEDALNEVLWSLTDRLGSVRDVATQDATGTTSIVNHLTYDAFGNPLSETNPAASPLLKFTGKYYDDDIGAQYNLHRWLRNGRWLSEDPLGFGGGDVNVSRYVGNGPTNATDPSGLLSAAGHVTVRKMIDDAGFLISKGELNKAQAFAILLGRIYDLDRCNGTQFLEDAMDYFMDPEFRKMVGKPARWRTNYTPPKWLTDHNSQGKEQGYIQRPGDADIGGRHDHLLANAYLSYHGTRLLPKAAELWMNENSETDLAVNGIGRTLGRVDGSLTQPGQFRTTGLAVFGKGHHAAQPSRY